MDNKKLQKVAIRIWITTIQKMRTMYGNSYRSCEPPYLPYEAFSLRDYIFYRSDYVLALESLKMVSTDTMGIRLNPQYLQMTTTDIERELQ